MMTMMMTMTVEMIEMTVCAENTDKGKYGCMADLLFDWFVFGKTRKTVVD